jgi:hypothetical protein
MVMYQTCGVEIAAPDKTPSPLEGAGLGTLYFFHPDHLGTATFLTDINGNAYQFFINLPFGESMAEQRLEGSLNNVYKFNEGGA